MKFRTYSGKAICKCLISEMRKLWACIKIVSMGWMSEFQTAFAGIISRTRPWTRTTWRIALSHNLEGWPLCSSPLDHALLRIYRPWNFWLKKKNTWAVIFRVGRLLLPCHLSFPGKFCGDVILVSGGSDAGNVDQSFAVLLHLHWFH